MAAFTGASRKVPLIIIRISAALLIASLLTFSIPQPAHANTICVTVDGNGNCETTLGFALQAAVDGDTILVGPGTFTENITIDKSVTIVGSGATSSGTIIDGNGAATRKRVILINPGKTVTISNLIVQNGWTADGNNAQGLEGGGIANYGNSRLENVIIKDNRTGDATNNSTAPGGGGVYNGSSATLIIYNSWIIDNGTGNGGSDYDPSGVGGGNGGYGGGIQNQGALTLILTTVTRNITGYGGYGETWAGQGGIGGGISSSGSVTLINSSVSNNITGNGGFAGNHGGAGGSGGGIWSSWNVVLSRSTISGNKTGRGRDGSISNGASGSGAGIYFFFRPCEGCNQTLTVTTSTISSNITGYGLDSSPGGTGGGIFMDQGTAYLTQSTIAFNQVDSSPGNGGGIANPSGTVNLKNTILGNNYQHGNPNAVHDCSGTLTSQGHNLIQVPADCTVTQTTGDLFWTSPLLGQLQNTGGPTLTHELTAGSPALNAADNAACGSTDQRGFLRPVGQLCDIGATEAGKWIYFPLIIMKCTSVDLCGGNPP